MKKKKVRGSMPQLQILAYWVRERERIREEKERGAPPPWTDDEVLSAYRFCNVRREDDLVTRWIRDHIRVPFDEHQHLWLMLCIARQVNWPDTLRELMSSYGAWPGDEFFSPSNITAVLNARKSRGEKVYTGAYMISAPAEKGADKQAYVAETVVGGLWDRRREFRRPFVSLEDTHRKISATNGWGPFMAYQAVVDMRFTPLLRDAPDVATWAAAGPGTLRGLNRLHGRAVDAPQSQASALAEMRGLHPIIQDAAEVVMDFSDVPNILCEFDKYLRVARGEGKPRARYVPGRGA